MKRKNRKSGFTLIELMVVAIVIAILAAVAIPLMRGNKDRAMATEAQAGCGAVRTALRVYYAEHDAYPAPTADVTTLPGIKSGDLDGVYFDTAGYATSADASGYLITATGTAGGDAAGETVTLNADGDWGGSLL